MPPVSKAIIEGEKDLEGNKIEATVTFLDEEDNEVDLGPDAPLTGYEVGTEAALDETDTVLTALGKLEARVLALETP